MALDLEFRRDINNVLASANDHGLYVIAGWTMAIPREAAIEYVKSFNTSPNAGFFEHDSNVILSHNDGKLTLSREEATAVADLIKAAYGPF